MRSDLLTRKAAAEYLGVSTSWLAHAFQIDKGPAIVKMGGVVRYLQSDLDDYIQQCRSESPTYHRTQATTYPTSIEARLARPLAGEAELLRQMSERFKQRRDQRETSKRGR